MLPAEDPSNLADRITDTANVLSEADLKEAQAAIDDLTQEANIDLFVAYVATYGDLSNEEWTNTTAEMSNLGINDVLLTVAVEDGAWAVSADETSEITFDEARRLFVESGQSDLSAGQWGEAIVSYAEALKSEVVGGEGVGTAPFVILGLAGAGTLAYVAYRTSKKQKESAKGAKGKAPLSLEELGKQAGTALVAVDDELRASDQELGFAKAQFGLQATQQFEAALAEARKKVTAAFEIQKQLEDSTPETEDQRRRGLERILELTSGAHEQLAAQKKSFDELRSIEQNAEDVLEQMTTRAREVRDRIPGAQSVLSSLASQYPESALTSVKQNAHQAEALLNSADHAISEGTSRLSADDRAAAAVNARIAEQAIGTANELVDEIYGADEALKEARPKLESAIASITGDVADANRLAPDVQEVVAARDRAQKAIAGGIEAQEGGDPLAAIQHLTQAETALDKVLEPYRKRAEVVARTAQLFEQRLRVVRQRVDQADALVSANRGAMDSRPRTLASEARRLLENAVALRETDPEKALEYLGTASSVADDAVRTAEAQRDSFPWRQEQVRGGGVDLGSLILGGILSDMFDDDDYDRRRRTSGYSGGSIWGSGTWGGGSWGSSRPRSSGGSWGGSFGGSSRGSMGGSFGRGGGGGRRSGGGRF